MFTKQHLYGITVSINIIWMVPVVLGPKGINVTPVL